MSSFAGNVGAMEVERERGIPAGSVERLRSRASATTSGRRVCSNRKKQPKELLTLNTLEEPRPCRCESGGGGGVHTDRLGIDIELCRESLSRGRDGVKGGTTRCLDDLDSSASNTYNDRVSTHERRTK